MVRIDCVLQIRLLGMSPLPQSLKLFLLHRQLVSYSVYILASYIYIYLYFLPNWL